MGFGNDNIGVEDEQEKSIVQSEVVERKKRDRAQQHSLSYTLKRTGQESGCL